MKDILLTQLKNIPIQDRYEDYFKSIAKNMFIPTLVKPVLLLIFLIFITETKPPAM